MHDPSDGRSGGVLEVAGDGQGGRHRGRVGPGGVAGVVEEGRVLSSCLLMRKGRTGVPQLVIRADDLTGIHQVGWGERWRSPPTSPTTWPWSGRPLQGRVTGVGGGRTARVWAACRRR